MKRTRIVLALCIASLCLATPAAAQTTINTDEPASGAPFMGLGVQLDPYDTFTPTPAQWNLIFQRLDYMRPGFLRVVEPASDYFGGYDAAHNPIYRWTAPHVLQLQTILGYAQSRGIPVVLGDWSNPLIAGDPRIPAGFLQQLHADGFTNVRYYNLMNEPNDNGSACEFTCWAGIVRSLSAEFAATGVSSWLQLVGPDNANSWDDTAAAQAVDQTSGLDGDNPIGGDSWLTATLLSIPSLIGAYDSHRYATIWGIEHGVYGDQMRARREQIDNLDSPAKSYFAGEVGLTARQVSPFLGPLQRDVSRISPALIDPSVRPDASAFVDSQPHIEQFDYGVWMADMMIQSISAGTSGASAWDLDDAMHVGGQYGADNLKQWGFWNSFGGQDGYPAGDLRLRPWYDTWSVLARSFPAGAEPLAVPSTGIASVRIAAAKIPNAGGGFDVSFAVVNDSNAAASLTLSVPAATAPVTLQRYDYFAEDRPTDANGFPVPAQVQQGAVLSEGLTVALPSRGVVVLSSLGAGTPIALDDGRTKLVDNLLDWREVAARTRGLTLAHRNPPQFDDDGSRATVAARARGTQALVYSASQITSFELKAYTPTAPATPPLRVYRSLDGRAWAPIALASTQPAPAIGGRSYLTELLPDEPIPAGTDRLKIAFTKARAELGQVTIAAGRLGPACLAPTVQAQGESLAGVPLGIGRRGLRVRLGMPVASSARAWRYCVLGGGAVIPVFSARGGASLIASTAPGYRPGGIGPGSPLARLRKLLRSGLARSAGRGILLATIDRRQLVFLTSAGRVQAVAIATPSVLSSRRSLARAVGIAERQVRAAPP
jgi:hypothetical protein